MKGCGLLEEGHAQADRRQIAWGFQFRFEVEAQPSCRGNDAWRRGGLNRPQSGRASSDGDRRFFRRELEFTDIWMIAGPPPIAAVPKSDRTSDSSRPFVPGFQGWIDDGAKGTSGRCSLEKVRLWLR